MTKKTIWLAPGIAVALGIFALSTFLALPLQVEGVSHLDKWQHTFAYLVLSFSFLLGFQKGNSLTQSKSFWVLILSSTYGLLLEFVQYQFFAYRYFEWADALANVLGAVIGFLLFWSFRKKIGG